MIGVSHHDVSLQNLDVVSRRTRSIASSLVRSCFPDIAGAVLLSTCNRVELYVEGSDSSRSVDVLRSYLREQLEDDAPTNWLESVRIDKEAARHLFAVTVGLESMIVGEHEIAGQVRQAASTARTEQTMSPALDRLFRSASMVSREVATTSNLGTAGRSLVTVALDLVERKMGPLAGCTALVIGTGAYARVVHGALDRRGVANRLVYSVSGRATEFAESEGGKRVTQVGLPEAITEADLIISSSGAPHKILETDMLAMSTKNRSRPLVIVDLALSRDVEESVGDLENVWLIDLDVVSRHAPKEHTLALAVAYRAVEEAAENFVSREFERTADGVIVALRRFAMERVEAEFERVQRSKGEEIAQEVRESIRRVVREILHTPTVRAQQFTREGRLDEVEHAIQVLLGINTQENRKRGNT
jgi:glutamyl-tRNA reductase